MKKALIRILALVCMAGILFTTACGANTAVALTVDGIDINAGEYIFAQLKANSNAIERFGELNPDTDTNADGFDFYAQELDGKTFRDWVIDDAIEIIAKRRVYEKKFEELGLSFTAEELSEQKKRANDTWNNENSDLASYGISEKTLGLFYETIGISKQSYQKMAESDAMAEKVFHALYGEGGVKEVPADELVAEFSRMYFRYRVIAISLYDAEGAAITDEAELKTLEDMGNDYVERLKDGESWFTIADEYQAFIDERDAVETSDETSEENADEGADETNETEETNDENDFDRMISLAEIEYYNDDLYNKIGALELNMPELYMDEYGYYVIMRLDITERDDWFEENKESVIHSLKGEEIDNETAELAKEIEIVRNEAAIKRYDPKKAL